MTLRPNPSPVLREPGNQGNPPSPPFRQGPASPPPPPPALLAARPCLTQACPATTRWSEGTVFQWPQGGQTTEGRWRIIEGGGLPSSALGGNNATMGGWITLLVGGWRLVLVGSSWQLAVPKGLANVKRLGSLRTALHLLGPREGRRNEAGAPHQPPIANHQSPPTATNSHQQPTANRHQPRLNI